MNVARLNLAIAELHSLVDQLAAEHAKLTVLQNAGDKTDLDLRAAEQRKSKVRYLFRNAGSAATKNSRVDQEAASPERVFALKRCDEQAVTAEVLRLKLSIETALRAFTR